MPKSRRVYAYLRYSEDGKTVNRYIGNADAPTREEALALAWTKAREKGLVPAAPVVPRKR